MIPYDGKIGRNDPCFCGSGKKFKKCCLERKNDGSFQTIGDPLWKSLRKVIDGLSQEILEFAADTFGTEVIEEAWKEFLFEDTETQSPLDPFHLSLFFSWFSYNWIPDPFSETFKTPPELEERTISQVFLLKRGKNLDPLAIRYIEACQKAVFSYYDILSTTPGTGFRVRDIFTGEIVDVLDKSASESALPGTILFGNIVRVEHLTLLDSNATYLIPVTKKPEVLALRSFIRGTFPHPSQQDLAEYDIEMFDLYHSIMEDLRNPLPPTLLNTDEELVVLHKIVYKIASPRQTFDALKTLSFVQSEEEILRSSVFDKSGNLIQATIPWSKSENKLHKSWENTLLGQLEIDGETLTIQTNSDNRAQIIRKIVESRLPENIHFSSDTIISQKDLQASALKEETPRSGLTTGPESPPKETDEMRAAIEVFIRKQMLDWPHQKIPLLGGKTPLEAILTEDGRDLVESLLLEMERQEVHPGMLMDRKIMAEIRKTLGM